MERIEGKGRRGERVFFSSSPPPPPLRIAARCSPIKESPLGPRRSTRSLRASFLLIARSTAAVSRQSRERLDESSSARATAKREAIRKREPPSAAIDERREREPSKAGISLCFFLFFCLCERLEKPAGTMRCFGACGVGWTRRGGGGLIARRRRRRRPIIAGRRRHRWKLSESRPLCCRASISHVRVRERVEHAIRSESEPEKARRTKRKRSTYLCEKKEIKE